MLKKERRKNMFNNENENKLVVPPFFSLDIKPFWNDDCNILQEHCFLPSICKRKKNFVIEKINNLIDKVTVPSFFSSQFHLTLPAISSLDCKDVTVKISRKVRLYFQNAEQKRKYHEMMTVYRRAYNLAVDIYIHGKNKLENGNYIDDIRPDIRAKIKSECEESGSVYDINVIDEACKEARTNFFTICKNNVSIKSDHTGETYQELGFKSRKSKVKSFSHHKMGRNGVCYKSLGKIRLTETLHPEAYGKTVKVICDHNRWFIAVLKLVTISGESQARNERSLKMIALDPGSRNFMTAYSQNEAYFMGKGFSVNTLLPLAKEMRACFKVRRRLKNLPEYKMKEEERPQWFNDRLLEVENHLDEIEQRRQDAVTHLHHECADFLVKNYDIILLPQFETKKMVKKSEERALNRRAVHNLLSLKHYKFKDFLLWKGKKEKKKIIIVNESYTSQTASWNGNIIKDLKGSNKITMNDFSVDRDINGARNIYIKHLMLIFKFSEKEIKSHNDVEKTRLNQRGLAPHSEQQTPQQ
jgi:putative transposase